MPKPPAKTSKERYAAFIERLKREGRYEAWKLDKLEKKRRKYVNSKVCTAVEVHAAGPAF